MLCMLSQNDKDNPSIIRSYIHTYIHTGNFMFRFCDYDWLCVYWRWFSMINKSTGIFLIWWRVKKYHKPRIIWESFVCPFWELISNWFKLSVFCLPGDRCLGPRKPSRDAKLFLVGKTLGELTTPLLRLRSFFWLRRWFAVCDFSFLKKKKTYYKTSESIMASWHVKTE